MCVSSTSVNCVICNPKPKLFENAMATASTPSTPNNAPSAQPVAALLAEMVLQYAQRDTSQTLNDWLANALVQRTGASPEAARTTADNITSYLQQSHHLRTDLRAHVAQGKSRSSWIARQIERIASDHQASPTDVAALSALLSGQTSPEGMPTSPRDWNDISRIAFAKDLEQQLLLHTAGTYTKLPYLKVRQADPIAEIKAVLSATNVTQHALALDGEAGNHLAVQELREYLQLAASQMRVLLSDVVDRFTGIPWGWKPEWEITLLIARLYMAGEIQLMRNNTPLTPSDAVEVLTKSVRFKEVAILKRKTADAAICWECTAPAMTRPPFKTA